MQFTTLTLAALSAASAIAVDVAVHVVRVSGAANNSLTYTPNSLKANVGDMVQFQFGVGNHTVTQSAFDSPCSPLRNGIFSGFMPVTASATTVPTYTILVNATNPMWFYCSTGKHCQNGMVMVINENPTANASRTLTNYAAAAKGVANSGAPSSPANGTAGTGSNTGGSGSGTGTGGSGTSTDSPSSTSSTPRVSQAAANIINAPSVAGLLLAGAAMFL